MAEAANIWDKIQQGVKETERLIAQKQYNLAMVRSRQTLEYMVKSLGARACIIDGDLSDTIDQLYDGQWITKTTKERYHKLRMLGNKAVHEGNDNPADANQAYRILADEFYTFANDYNPNRRRPQRSSSASSRPKSGPGSVRKRKKRKKAPAFGILGILLPVLFVIVLSIFIVRLLVPDDKAKETSAPETTPAMVTEAEPTTPEETEPTTPEETEPPTEETTTSAVYKTTSTLNVRSMPSTDSRILAQLAPGEEVTVIGVHDQQWSIISYEGQDAYVATAYLTQ